ncbi:replication factor A protein 2 [Mortierella claussenii]|nr:replication factor A protein 2 [Mortierella claussenii]
MSSKSSCSPSNSCSPYGSGSQGQGYMQDSFNNDAGAVKKYINHVLRPVTIKQLHAASQTQADADFKVDGQDIGQVTFIAVVRSRNSTSTSIGYHLEDGTGSIEGRKFMGQDEDPSQFGDILENSYVRIFGSLREYQQKITVNIFGIRLLTDMNELTHHNLEVMLCHVSATRSKTMGGQNAAMSSTSYNNISANRGAGSLAPNEEIRQQIADLIKSADQVIGLHRNEIYSRFTHASGGLQALNAIIDDMVADGFIYTGTDEDHYLCPM